MKTTIDQPEAEALIQGYIEGSLSETECARLKALLSQDPATVDLILEGLREETFIRTVVAELPSTVSAPAELRDRAMSRFLPWRRIMVRLLQFKLRPATTLGVAACLVTAIALFAWCFGPVVGAPVLAGMEGGQVSLERAGQVLAPTVGTPLQAGDVLRTPAGAMAVIAYAPEKTGLTLNPGTELKLAALSGGKRFELRLGKIEASVARQRLFRAMVFRTPQAEARVLGTRFTLFVATNSTRLEVSEGTVRFTSLRDRKSVRVTAGNYAIAAGDSELGALPLTGSILREYWTNVPGVVNVGYLVLDPRFPDHPSGRTNLTTFETTAHQGQNYGARFRGYLHPPVTGKYRFSISANAGANLFLSPDDKPEHKRQIGYANHTGPREWTKHEGQESPLLTLVAGRRYYIEAMHEQSKGGDHLAVAWQRPGQDREVISGEFLSRSNQTPGGRSDEKLSVPFQTPCGECLHVDGVIGRKRHDRARGGAASANVWAH